MKILNLSVGAMILRLHIMSAVVVTLGFLGLMYVGIVIGMLIFLATLMGVQWKHINPFRPIAKSAEYDWRHRHHPIHH